jgi:CubicO group peptidase (beta-lactamase class C family)
MTRDTPVRRFASSVIVPGLLAGSLFSHACTDQGASHYDVPPQTGDGWQTASLEDVGMNTARMAQLMSDLRQHPDHWVHSIVVVKDGKLVFEEYFPGQDLDLSNLGNGVAYVTRNFARDTLHSAASVSKSVTSILLGIALADGLVRSTDEAMFSFFRDYDNLSSPVKSQITVQHMLTMTTGLPWNEAFPYDDPRNDLAAMLASDDPIAYVLSKSTVATPGDRFIYNSGTANLVGEIVHRATGMTLGDFAAQRLFTPLGIDAYAWYPFPNAPETTVASSTLFLRPRDMAKIGQLYLDGGVWNGTRVVPTDWVTQSTRAAVNVEASETPVPSLNPRYGFLWWLGTFSTGPTETYFAAGWGGQFIFVFPDPRMVVVFTAGGFKGRSYDALLQIVNQYILPAAGR